MSVKIIVDSASDITTAFAKEHNIGFVPLKTTLGDTEYRDGIDIVPDEFFEKLEANKELARTSQVNPGEFAEVFDRAVADGDEVVVITMSGALSGTYQSAVIAAADYPGKIFVINSLTATAGEQVLIERALQLQKAGKSAAEIYAELDDIRHRMRLFVRLETLEYLKRGGRISAASAFVGGMLSIKPVLTLNGEGKLETVGKARGIKQSHKMMNDSILACGGIDFSMPVVMTYAGDLNDGAVQRFLDDSTETVGDYADRIKRGQLGCVIGTHTGPGAIVIAFVPKNA